MSLALLPVQTRVIPNEPPLVPYRIPIIGHAFSLQKDPKNFLKKLRKQYGHIFSIYLFGRIVTIVDSEFMHEVYDSDDLSLTANIEDWIPFKLHFGIDTFTCGEVVTKIIRKYLHSSKDIKIFSERLEQTFTTIIEHRIGNCKNPRTIDSSLNLITEGFARSLTCILFNEEKLCNDRDILDAFVSYGSPNGDNYSTIMLLNFIHPWFYHFIVKYINNPAKKNLDILMRKIKPYIAKRFENRINNDKKDQKSIDFLQMILSVSNFDKNSFDELLLGSVLMHITFAILYPTSTFCNAVILEYATRLEYWQELQDEQSNIVQEYGNSLSYESVLKMEKLDSFIKESARTYGTTHILIGKKFTFSNGIEVPYGRRIALDFSMIHGEESGIRNADMFDGFRYVGMNSSFTYINREVLTFGLGRRACPGRNFATYVIKITTKSGQKSPYKVIMGSALPLEETLIFQNL
ncbi:1126_t:CDS:10 [Ambispora leptoticha]|uniref:1126_t:CDS:1 n=1 Tax=Ambispora leptoticha TaxID=144679 RepID=A0A9N9CYE8_9GLOM|nr:1126_t:CDS:10 [Ambispora leptoticha]